LDGGFRKVPPIGTCGGVLVAVLLAVAAGMPMILTSLERLPSMIPLNECGTIMGGAVPGGWTRWKSVAVTWSPCFAAGIPISSPQLTLTVVPFTVVVPELESVRPLFASILVSAEEETSTFCALELDGPWAPRCCVVRRRGDRDVLTPCRS
jgi:hypothetical protein